MKMPRLSSFINSIYPIVVTIISAWLAHTVPFSFLPIGSTGIYGTSLGVYSTLATLLFKAIIIWLQKKESSIKIIYSLSKDDFPMNNELFCSFSSDVANVYAKVEIIGKARYLLETNIVFIFPNQVHVQAIEKYKKYYEIDNKKNIVKFNLSSAFNFEKTGIITDTVILGFSVIKHDDRVESYIETNIVNKPKSIRLSLNKLKFTK